MFGVWIIAHMTKAGNLQSRAEQMYHRSDNASRMLIISLHRLRKFLQILRTKVGFLIATQAETVQCLGYGLWSK